MQSSSSSSLSYRANWLVPREDGEGGTGVELVPEGGMSALSKTVQVGGRQPCVNLDKLVLEGEWASRAETEEGGTLYKKSCV